MINSVPLEVKESPCLSYARGKELLAKYNDSIAKYGDKAKQTLARYALDADETFLGSNPFMNVQLGGLVQLAIPAELETAVRRNPDFFRDKYEDVALVLRSNGDTYKQNDSIAKSLAKQVKKRLGAMPTAENPARISLKGLSLKEDANSQYGLVFVLGDGAEVISVPEFAYANNGKKFAKTDEKGVPIFNNQGNRIFYARDNGLSRLCLDGDLDLGSGFEDLACSFSDGRVPLVFSEAGSQKNLGLHQELYTKALASVMQRKGITIAGLEAEVMQEVKRLSGEN